MEEITKKHGFFHLIIVLNFKSSLFSALKFGDDRAIFPDISLKSIEARTDR